MTRAVLTLPFRVQGNEKDIVVSEDDGIRPGMTPQALGALKPVFKKGGTTTAGNSSQVKPQHVLPHTFYHSRAAKVCLD